LINENPYRLASEVQGIGFLSADKIAQQLGIPKDSAHRAEAGLLYTLDEFASEGHVFARMDALLARAEILLEIDIADLRRAADRLVLMGRVRCADLSDGAAVYLPRLFLAEENAAKSLARLLSMPARHLPFSAEEAIHRAETLSEITLAPQQRRIFSVIGRAKVVVLTGGPGTGKTTALRGLAAFLIEAGLKVSLTAPTGRAAKRMAESTGRDARTIHRLLEFTPATMRFERCAQKPLDADVVVVDEVSMVDIELFASLLDALRPQARLVLVGDPDQLPSVAPGTVLADMLWLGEAKVDKLAVVRLTEIFRQAKTSLIITGAHDVLAGREPHTGRKGSAADLFLVERENPQECLDVIKELVKSRIPSRFGLDPLDDIQILTPMHKGLLGATNLNRELQLLLNPGEGGLAYRQYRFKLKDKVMQVRNNYDLEVFNGDIGRITAIDEELSWIEVRYMERTVRYPESELDQIVLAYACSVHKSQGSEYPAVIIPLHTQHFVMLQRNLLYTAITRGKGLVVIVGPKRAVDIAVRNNRQTDRGSLLGRRVLETIA
jgi:exodeoxyribonuclease V alpha subunit